MEIGIRMARDPQGAGVRRRYLLFVDVMAEPPFPVVRQGAKAMGDAWMADTLALVDAGQVGSPYQQVDARRAVLERGGCRIHRRRAAADHGHAQPAQVLAAPGIG